MLKVQLTRYKIFITRIPAAILLLFAIVFIEVGTSDASEKIVLQLAWKHQFQFAGYYAAMHKGYYRQSGLDVTIVEGGKGKFAREEVLSGRAQYGVAGAELLLHRRDGNPFVVLAPIFQHSPSILLARRDTGISNIQDLVGKRVMLLPEDKDADILAAFLNEGVSLDTIHRLDQTYNLDDLIEGRTDAVSAYVTNEPWQLLQQGVEAAVISPQLSGVDFYSDCLFTTEVEIRKHPRRVQAFLDASLQGWEYAMAHTQEIIDLLIAEYGVKKQTDHLYYEAAAIRKMMLPELVQIGHMNPGRWRHIKGVYQKLGLLDVDFPLEGFLYDSGSQAAFPWLNRTFFAAIFVIVLLAIGTGFLVVFNRRLRSEVQERKQAEVSLRESENQISSIFRSAPVGIGSVVNRVMINVNIRLCEMTGYNETELIGQSARILYPSDEDFAFVGREKYAQIADHGTGMVETRWQKKDGTIMDVLLSSTPADLQDQSKGVTFTALDITERKQAEKELKLAHERILTILDSIDSTVYVADMDTCEILFMNKRMITDFGGDKTGDICYSAFRKNSERCECCTNNQLVDNHGNPAGVHIWNDKNPVTCRYYINYDRAIEWTDGRLVRMQIATDITDLKKMEAQLLQAQKMESVGRLAGGVAHDFNNMLGVILGHTELALLQADENHDLYSDLKEIQTAAQRSADITKQLLAFARKQTISPRKLDLNDTVESMLNMLRRIIGEDIDLVWKPSTHLWPVKMDPSQIDQILANLCVNARDAIDGVGKLTIETGRKSFDEEYCSEHPGFIPGDFVLLAVSDNGCGMDKDILDNLFEPFFTTKDVGKGTGLGLATIYGICKQNNGFINVYSEPGQGSTFNIYLPRLLADEDTDMTVPEKKAAVGGTETILLVEDEPMILDMTTTMLGMLGYTVLAAASPDEAIRLAKDHTGKVHLLMSDVVLPEMNGRDLAGQIVHLYPGIRLLFMSGYTANVIAHQGVLDDGVAFIQKPFSMADMTEKVREVLDMATDKS